LLVALVAITCESATAATATAAGAPPAIDMADMFIVEQDGGWFCNSEQLNGATCPTHHVSRLAAQDLLASLGSQSLSDLFLRVAKARNDCVYPLPAGPTCTTGVPPEPCDPDAFFKSPACTLATLSGRGAKLGIVIGALGEDNRVRSVRDVTWHACQVSRADRAGLYDFIFLDAGWRLKDKLRRAVPLMQAGKYALGGQDLDCPDGAGGHPVITNDTAWKQGDAGNAPLDTGAWGHAKRLGLLDHDNPIGAIQRAARGRAGRALTTQDKAFVRAVRAQGSVAVLRLEVPSQSSRFARLQPQLQCSLLARWASLQSAYGFTLIHPLYVHGGARGKGASRQANSSPYDSFVEGTYVYQRALMSQYPSSAALSDGFCGSRTANIPCGTVVAPTPDRLGLRLQITKTARANPDPVSCAAARSVIHAYWRTPRVLFATQRTPGCSQALGSPYANCAIGSLVWVCGHNLDGYDTACSIGNRIGWTVNARP
jgi:hypothetical protein